MEICYIRETEETCDLVKRIIIKIKSFFNIIEIEQKDNTTIYYLPIFKNAKITKYIVKRLSKKTSNILRQNGISNVVLSKYLETISDLKLNLYSQNINILNGRYLFKCLIYSCTEYILKRKNKKMEFRRSNYISK